MHSQELPVSLLSLEGAIDPRPLTVSPDTSVAEAIATMGKAYSSCNLPSLNLSLNWVLKNQARASAILVVEQARLLGIFGEREALAAILSGRDLAAIPVTQGMYQPATALNPSETSDIFDALVLLRQHQIHHLPVIDEGGCLMGLVTPPGIRDVLQLDELLKSRQLSEIVSPPAIGAPATHSVLDLAQLMLAHRVDSIVLWTEERSQLAGIVTRRNIIQLEALKLDLSQIPARAVMNASVPCFHPCESILTAYWQMQQQRVQRFVVSEKPGELLGVVTPTSFLFGLDVASMRESVEQLQRSVEQFATEKASSSGEGEVGGISQPSEELAQLRHQLRCSQLLAGMALRIRESLDLQAILQRAVDEVRQFLQCDRAIVYRFNADMSGTVAVESVATGWRPVLNSTIRDTCFGKDYAQAYKQGRTQVVEDIYTANLTQCHIDILVYYDIRASLIVPILQGENLWGLLCTYQCAEPRRWLSMEVDLLKQLAIHMAIAIQQSELYQQVQAELAERKRTEEQLKISLGEKESLLKEVHHRVKNNLQIISSLLRLQSDYIEDEKALASFKDSQNRIRSMALIHQKLYQSRDVSNINFIEYIRDLVSHLLRSYTATSQFVNLNIESNDIWLNIDTAIPCGLIINELVSNSLKHAFPQPSPDNEIFIKIHLADRNRFRLIVSDNGIGFPQGIDFRDTDSLGLQLVCTFTEQLEGAIDLETRNGTAFIITFTQV
jgi:two-component sensor histidine kinase/CBS domain-containing protein